MDDSHGSLTPWLRRLKRRFGGSDDDAGSSDESGWKRYANLIQVVVTLAILFGGVFGGVLSTLIDRMSTFAQTGATALSGIFWPVLVSVTVIAVVVCVVVVALGVRNT